MDKFKINSMLVRINSILVRINSILVRINSMLVMINSTLVKINSTRVRQSSACAVWLPFTIASILAQKKDWLNSMVPSPRVHLVANQPPQL